MTDFLVFTNNSKTVLLWRDYPYDLLEPIEGTLKQNFNKVVRAEFENIVISSFLTYGYLFKK